MVGFDFDGVIFDMAKPLSRELSRLLGREISPEHINTWRLEDCFGLAPRQVREVVLAAQREEWLQEDHLIPGAREVLSSLAEDRPLVVITARPQTGPVADFLSRQLEVDRGRLTVAFSPAEEKGVLAYRWKLRAFVDDYPLSLLSVMQYGVQPLLFDQPWNRKLPSGRSQAFQAMKRVYGWTQLERVLKGG